MVEGQVDPEAIARGEELTDEQFEIAVKRFKERGGFEKTPSFNSVEEAEKVAIARSDAGGSSEKFQDDNLSDLPKEKLADIKRQQAGQGVEHTEPDTSPLSASSFGKVEEGARVQKRNKELRSNPKAFAAQINKTAKDIGLDPKLFMAVATIETAKGTNVQPSSKGARGPMQITEATAILIVKAAPELNLTVEQILNDDEANMRAAAWLLKDSIPRYKTFGKDKIDFIFADYHSGAGNVSAARKKAKGSKKWDEVKPFMGPKTRAYIAQGREILK